MSDLELRPALVELRTKNVPLPPQPLDLLERRLAEGLNLRLAAVEFFGKALASGEGRGRKGGGEWCRRERGMHVH
jgi:hypothetical protein